MGYYHANGYMAPMNGGHNGYYQHQYHHQYNYQQAVPPMEDDFPPPPQIHDEDCLPPTIDDNDGNIPPPPALEALPALDGMEQNGNPLNAQNGNVQIEEVEIGNVDDNNSNDVQWKLTMQVVSTENTEIDQNGAAENVE